MRYLALATDYDGTLATAGTVPRSTIEALERLRTSGRRAIIVTGRRLEDLREACPNLELFACVVAENGAVLYWPETRQVETLAPPVPDAFAEALAERGVPFDRGRVLLATNHPHEVDAIQVVHALSLELHIIFNGDAVMVLPPGVNKGSGLRAALYRMGLSPHEVVAVGDSANDHSLFEVCECAVAVANAVPAVRDAAHFATASANGQGVVELIDELVQTDLAGRIVHGRILIGLRDDGSEIELAAYGQNLLVAGPSGAGKSTFATGVIERLIEQSYQVCIIDPEGDYSTLDEIVTLGSRLRVPHVSEILGVLSEPTTNVVINLLGVPLDERPAFFRELMPALLGMRARCGRPHWVVIDEVHHLLPAGWGLASNLLPRRIGEGMLVTVRPAQVARPVLELVDVAVAVGPSPDDTLAELAAALGRPAAAESGARVGRGHVLVWNLRSEEPPLRARVVPARAERLRHMRKYAEGNLGPNSFVFRGPDGRLALRATNLVVFCQLADGVDNDTWLYHLRGGHFSEWLRTTIKDPDLAREVAAIEAEATQLSPRESRRLVCDAIERRYTLPA